MGQLEGQNDTHTLLVYVDNAHYQLQCIPDSLMKHNALYSCTVLSNHHHHLFFFLDYCEVLFNRMLNY